MSRLRSRTYTHEHHAYEQGLNFREKASSLKFSQNCEFRLFQRPDEAVHRGFDKTTELDMSKNGNFISNFQPMTRADIQGRLSF